MPLLYIPSVFLLFFPLHKYNFEEFQKYRSIPPSTSSNLQFCCIWFPIAVFPTLFKWMIEIGIP